MHSSRMRTARSLTSSRSILPWTGGGGAACGGCNNEILTRMNELNVTEMSTILQQVEANVKIAQHSLFIAGLYKKST